MSSIARAAIAAVGLLACANGAYAANAKVYAKVGVTADEVAAQQASCKKAVSDAGVVAAPVNAQPPYGDYSMSGAVGTAIGGAIAQAIMDAEARSARVPVCMRARGFARLELTDVEQASYVQAGDGPGRTAWHDAFLKGDIDARVAAGLTPAVPPLPAAQDAPFLVGGVRLEPAKLALASGPIAAKGVLLTGEGEPRGTARVKADSDISQVAGFWKVYPATAHAGALFHQVYQGRPVTSETEEPWTLWCGPVTSKQGPAYTCVASGHAGYRSYPAVGQEWLARPDPRVPLMWFGDFGLKIPFELEVIPPEATYQIALRVTAVSQKTVTLSAVAMHDGAEVEFWSGVLRFGDTGRAELPFWTQTLVLTRVDRSVTGAFEPRADGKGWYD